MSSVSFHIVSFAATPDNNERLRELLATHWGGDIISRGQIHTSDDLLALFAIDTTTDEILGFVTYRLFEQRDEAEVISLNSLRPGCGIGTALLQAAVEAIREAGFPHATLITTNDNLHAVRFYQKRGWRLIAVHLGAVDDARRRFKPQIPLWGEDYLPLRDEWEMELRFDDDTE